MFENVFNNVKTKKPLVHNITNYVTVNDCANMILATGASPIMADDINEVEEITSICQSLVINIGTLNERTVKSMIKAGIKANELDHPVILDPVGIGASNLRTETVQQLMKKVSFSVIRGNISEIKAVYDNSATTKGVDADESDLISLDNMDSAIDMAKRLSLKTSAVVVITGVIDIVTDGNMTYIIKNGNPMMSNITGTGCMLTALIGGYCGANYDYILDATACAVASMSIAGELAYKRLQDTNNYGTSSYRTFIIDEISHMSIESLNKELKVEAR